MQLPRGTFRSIQKGVNFSDVLAEMVSSRFTGTCTLSSAVLNGTLVFRSGICVLAKIQDQYGDKGWTEVMSVQDLVTDLALSDFNSAQVQLALEFNKKARVTLPTTSGAARTDQPAHKAPFIKSVHHEPAKASHPARYEQRKREPPVPVPREPVAAEEAPAAVSTEVREDTSVTPPQPAGPEEGRLADTGKEPVRESSSKRTEKIPGTHEESDLDMFDSMDLDDVALKIRKDCKIILKQLQLDHLTEK